MGRRFFFIVCLFLIAVGILGRVARSFGAFVGTRFGAIFFFLFIKWGREPPTLKRSLSIRGCECETRYSIVMPA